MREYRGKRNESEMVTTNEQLNNALARNDSEFESFQKMDDEQEKVLLNLLLEVPTYIFPLGMAEKDQKGS